MNQTLYPLYQVKVWFVIRSFEFDPPLVNLNSLSNYFLRKYDFSRITVFKKISSDFQCV